MRRGESIFWKSVNNWRDGVVLNAPANALSTITSSNYQLIVNEVIIILLETIIIVFEVVIVFLEAVVVIIEVVVVVIEVVVI